MAFELAPEARTAGYRLIVHNTIGSTSSDGMNRLRADDPGPCWVVSRDQTQGRGRRGAPWRTRPGNLFSSLALTTEADPAIVATLGFVAGLAVVRALDTARSRSAVGVGCGTQFQLKWPNDVLADGAKLVGILVETEMLGTGRRAVVIGIGVNVADAPDGLAYPAASLAGLGLDIRAEDVLAALSARWVEALAIWDGGRGFSEIRRDWLARATGVGGPVSVRSAGGIVAGSFETIDEHGQLVIEMRDGTRRAISAGDVHFGEAATARTEAVA